MAHRIWLAAARRYAPATRRSPPPRRVDTAAPAKTNDTPRRSSLPASHRRFSFVDRVTFSDVPRLPRWARGCGALRSAPDKIDATRSGRRGIFINWRFYAYGPTKTCFTATSSVLGRYDDQARQPTATSARFSATVAVCQIAVRIARVCTAS
jgi:hypothetical protein